MGFWVCLDRKSIRNSIDKKTINSLVLGKLRYDSILGSHKILFIYSCLGWFIRPIIQAINSLYEFIRLSKECVQLTMSSEQASLRTRFVSWQISTNPFLLSAKKPISIPIRTSHTSDESIRKVSQYITQNRD